MQGIKAIIGGVRGAVRRWWCATDGAIAVEMALVAPVLAMVAVPIIDIGMGTYTQMQVQEAAQAGVQYAADHGWSSAGVTQAAHDATSLPAASVTVTPAQSCGCATSTGVTSATCGDSCPQGAVTTTAGGSYVVVTVQAPYNMLVSYPGLSNPMTLTASAVVRLQ